MTLPISIDLLPPGVTSPTLGDMIETTGTAEFNDALMDHLRSTCDAEYCAGYRIGPAAPEMVSGDSVAHTRVSHYMRRALWTKDPSINYARTQLTGRQAMLIRMDVAHIHDPVTRELVWPKIRERVVIAARGRGGIFGISVMREGSRLFTATEIERLRSSAELSIALLARHSELTVRGTTPSVPEIEALISHHGNLTAREVEVCARIIRGLSTTGIALDLGVSYETIKTFRKLAYRRLGIGSERELLEWWYRRRGPGGPPAAGRLILQGA